ncbi:MAG: glycosyltransferase family 2 protein [Candidatus Saccharibacteria bacterium]|nr:glycosyltransferase family 2 protein [Pseudorhodobacter sp.]
MTLTCLIPAYNEEVRIAAVLQAVIGHPLIDQVLVIDDGSRDHTAEVVRGTSAQLIVLSPNGGKTAALVRGLAEAAGEFVLLVDADLVGLSADDLTTLIAPVLSGRADVSISLRQNAPFVWRWLGLDYISGERVLRKSVLDGQDAALKNLPKFGFEVFLNGLLIQQTSRIAVVRWPGVVSPLKSRKYGIWTGIVADFRMMGDLFRVVPPMGLLGQIRQMLRLRV